MKLNIIEQIMINFFISLMLEMINSRCNYAENISYIIFLTFNFSYAYILQCIIGSSCFKELKLYKGSI